MAWKHSQTVHNKKHIKQWKPIAYRILKCHSIIRAFIVMEMASNLVVGPPLWKAKFTIRWKLLENTGFKIS